MEGEGRWNLEEEPDPPVPTEVRIAGTGEVGLVRAPLADSVEVRVLDQFGEPVQGVGVRLEATAGDGRILPVSRSTRSDGRAMFHWILGSEPGTQTARLAVPSVPGDEAVVEAEARTMDAADVLVRPGGLDGDLGTLSTGSTPFGDLAYYPSVTGAAHHPLGDFRPGAGRSEVAVFPREPAMRPLLASMEWSEGADTLRPALAASHRLPITAWVLDPDTAGLRERVRREVDRMNEVCCVSQRASDRCPGIEVRLFPDGDFPAFPTSAVDPLRRALTRACHVGEDPLAEVAGHGSRLERIAREGPPAEWLAGMDRAARTSRGRLVRQQALSLLVRSDPARARALLDAVTVWDDSELEGAAARARGRLGGR